MAEQIVLDPIEINGDRTELDITPWIRAEAGVNWGEDEVEAYRASAMWGESVVDYRVPNRQVAIPLVLKTVGGTTFSDIRTMIQAKAALFQREGGSLKRTTATGTYYADVQVAGLGMSGGWLQAHRDVDVDAELRLELSPDFYGDEAEDLYDDFSVDTLATGEWVIDAGTNLSITGGQLVPASTGQKRLYRSDYTLYDGEVTAKITTGTAVPSDIRICARILDTTMADYICVGLGTSGLRVLKRDLDAASALQTTAYAVGTSTNYWVRCRAGGNKVVGEVFTGSEPTADSTPAATVTHTLTGANATKFGAGVGGFVGLDLSPGTTGERYDDFRAAGNVFVETSSAEVIGILHNVGGDYPARVRFVVDDDQGEDQLGVMWGFRSRNYSPDSTASLAYECEALQPLSPAAGTVLSGASGGTAVAHTTLGTAWSGVLSTNIGGTTYMTHVGTYRAFARVYSPAGDPISARLVWDVGDLVLPVENDPWDVPGVPGFYVADLGEVRLQEVPVGAHRWQGIVQARGGVGGEDIYLDRIWFQPVDESAGILRAVQESVEGLNLVSGPNTAGTLVDDAGVGSISWTNPTNASTSNNTYAQAQVSASALSHYLKVTSFGFAIPGGATILGVQAEIERHSDYPTGAPTRTSIDNRLRLVKGGVIQSTEKKSNSLWPTADTVKTYGGQTDLWGATLTATDVNSSGFGVALSIKGTDVSVATGYVDAIKLTVYYSNASWIPVADAVVYANQSCELRTDGMFREDSGGAAYGPVSWVEGDLPRLPVSGLEGRPVEVFVKTSRGDFDQLTDDGIDDFTVRFYYRPCWLTVPGS